MGKHRNGRKSEKKPRRRTMEEESWRRYHKRGIMGEIVAAIVVLVAAAMVLAIVTVMVLVVVDLIALTVF